MHEQSEDRRQREGEDQPFRNTQELEGGAYETAQ